MNIDAQFGSKYLKAAQLNGRVVRLTMKSVTIEEVETNKKRPILYFQQTSKALALNKTNAYTISAAYGKETDLWIGKQIELFEQQVEFGGKFVPAIRVRAVAGTVSSNLAAAATPTPVSTLVSGPEPAGEPFGGNDLDDDIPF